MHFDKQSDRFRERYFDAVIIGEQVLARTVVDEALEQGFTVPSIYLDILTPTQVRIGEMWFEGDLNIAQEHLATSITLAIMEKLRGGDDNTDKLGVRAIVTSVEGDQHQVGARMMADFLLADGWDVDFLSSPTPAEDLIEFVQARGGDIVALSSTLIGSLSKVKYIADTLHKMDSSLKVLLGGRSLHLTGYEARSLGCDAIAEDAFDGVTKARQLLGLAKKRLLLADHLLAIGLKMKAVRSKLQMTQQELANLSGLDRAYISMVEHGKQNLTLGAMVKIANALDISTSDLVGNSIV